MKSKVVLVAIACLVVTADAQEMWGSESPRPRWQAYALEGPPESRKAAAGGPVFL